MTPTGHLNSSRYGSPLLCLLAVTTPLKNAPEISTMTFSSAGLVVADIHGSIHILNQSFVSVASWVAHLGGRVTHMIERKGMLVTIGVRVYGISRF